MSKPKPLSKTHYWLRDLIEAQAVGKQHAMPLPEVARRMGITTRKVQTLKADLLEHGIVICSSTANPPGLYAPTCASEVLPYYLQQRSRKLAAAHVETVLRRKYPGIATMELRTPPLVIVPSGQQVTAQRALDLGA